MRRSANVLKLINDAVQPLGVFEPSQTEERTVYCTVRSVSYKERYEAASHGLRPELIVKLADTLEYNGERRCVLDEKEYTVMHEYLTQDGGVELTLARKGAAP
jgi:hypothetical protein